MATTLEQQQIVDERFLKAGTQAAAVAKAQEDALNGRIPAPTPAPAPEAKPAEKPRTADGKFTSEKAPEAKPEPKPAEKPKTDHIPALREALAKEAAKNKAKDAEMASLKAELTEIKDILRKGVAPQKPLDVEEQKRAEADTRWVRERLLPEFAPVMDAANLILAERRQREEADRVAQENLSKFDKYADILGVSPEGRQTAVRMMVSGEISGDSFDTTALLALKSVIESPAAQKADEEEVAGRARAEAEKKAATGLMGRSAPVTEPETNDFQRKLADVRKNKDGRAESDLIQDELARRLYPKFMAGHATPSA